ncbi:MAG: G-D-S-L family lipolytic protein [Bacteroidetes bacterium OLB12]|nr:MAG: G-D-S-L family lipolytic protein [Bacteroidetes bacterium OLB12]HNR72965.1 GDSL-type esterase/lipase family protein [Cyclobacteriaceae bacterium]HNU42916.1 GDSL-type esterase/lipase family protein [Cyclobacteriaceae bacterium]
MKWIISFLLLSSLSAFGQKRPYDTVPNLPEHYWVRMEKFKKEPVVPGKIIFLGNSITEGGRWRQLLKDSTVINRGIAGDNTFGVLARLDEIVKLKPASLFVLIGTNDLSKKIPDEAILENIFTMISRIKSGSPKTKIFIQSILPVNETVERFPQQFNNSMHINTINDQLARYATRLRYTYVDLYEKFIDNQGRLDAKYTFDGLHLNAAGYQRWVEILKELKHL